MPVAAAKIGPQDDGRPMTLEEFDHAEVEEGYLYELSRGIITVADVPGTKHMAVVFAVKDHFYAYKLAHPRSMYGIASGSECKLLLAVLESERHPDVAIYTTPPPDDEDVWSIWIPDLVIEVVSLTSVQRDYGEKREEYLAFGVKEYWIIDPERLEILVLTRFRGKWRERTVGTGDTLETKLFPGLRIPCAQIFGHTGKL